MQKISGLLLFCFLAIINGSVKSQNGFSDDFSDGNFTSNPTWLGETSKFQIDGNNRLQLNHVGASGTSNSSFLVTASSAIYQSTWEFYIKLDFDPSTSNYAKVYLVSNNADLTASLDGYYIRVGGQTGTVDNVRLYRQDGLIDTLLVDGISGTVATSPEVKIRVTKSITNEWELFLDQSATGNTYQSQGSAIDNKYSTSSFFGVYCQYSSTRFDKFFFDDFIVTDVPFQDTVPPVLTELTVLSNDSLRLSFNEKVEASSALNGSNFQVNNSIGNPSSLSFVSTDSTSLYLLFSSPFVNGTTYEIISKNVSDKAGNPMLNDTSNFTYLVPEKASFRDVVLNELYPDFSPSNGLPAGEFVELFNASSKIFDLSNWSLSDGTSTATLSAQILRPGEYLILCSQSIQNDFSPFGATQGQASFPSLNNTGDNITLKDNSGLLIDFVNYTDDWYQDNAKNDGGYTLEQINPFTNCIGRTNFIASSAVIGGTPGAINSSFDTLRDSNPPVFLTASVLAKDSILLEFDKFLDTNSVFIANYSFNPSISVASILNQAPNYQSVVLTLSTPLDSGVIYELSVSGITDCSGNQLANNSSKFIAIPGVASYRDIVINEIYPDESPSNGLPAGEFIELFNASSKVLDLKNWKLSDESSTVNLSSQILKPGEFIILCSNSLVPDFSSFGITQGVSISLTNAGENITLKDNNGVLIDFVNYTDDWYLDNNKKDGGYSLEQINPFTNCSGKNNFIASSAAIGGTPGTINSNFDTLPDVQAPSLVNALILTDTSILLEFNEPMDSLSVLSANYNISPNVLVSGVINQAPSYQSAIITLSSALDSGIIYTLSVTGINDCSGNPLSMNNSKMIALPDIATENDVVINEILFNPYSGGVDFVEIFNNSTKVIGLEYLRVANEEEDSVANIKEITTEPLIILPKEYLVLTENKANIIQNYPSSVAAKILEIKDLPSYNDDEGTVYLLNSSGIVVDRVTYQDDQHFDLLKDDNGVSLERINPNRPSNDPTNWHSASEKVGFATPGYKNSQDFSEIRFSGKVNLDPKIISPDNDGFQDILNINYQFEAPGYVANVSIFDRNGRLIKRLIKNELLDSEGTFSWDGTSDDNTKARVGIYVVLFEAFTTNGKQEAFKEVVTVASFLNK